MCLPVFLFILDNSGFCRSTAKIIARTSQGWRTDASVPAVLRQRKGLPGDETVRLRMFLLLRRAAEHA